jgi:hypothetical protein
MNSSTSWCHWRSRFPGGCCFLDCNFSSRKVIPISQLVDYLHSENKESFCSLPAFLQNPLSWRIGYLRPIVQGETVGCSIDISIEGSSSKLLVASGSGELAANATWGWSPIITVVAFYCLAILHWVYLDFPHEALQFHYPNPPVEA